MIKKLIIATLALISCSLIACPIVFAGFQSELQEGESEGSSTILAKVVPLLLHKEPSKKAPTVTVNDIIKGQHVDYDQYRLITLTPGIIQANRAGEIRGRSFGTIRYLSVDRYYSNVPSESIRYKKGEKFEYLHYRAEGSCIIRKNGKVYEIDVPWYSEPNKSGLYLVKKEVTEAWIRILNKKKKPIGWLLFNGRDSQVEYSDIEENGKQ